jgi:hypothetical protein
MAEIKTLDLDLGGHEVGYKWLAGKTPPRNWSPGRWVVRRDPSEWVIVFYSLHGPKYTIATFTPTDEGERAAKVMALKLVENARRTK